MKKLALFILLLLQWSCSNESDYEITGYWKGKLNQSSDSLDFVFKITEIEPDIYRAVVDRPQMDVLDVPLDKISYQGNRLILEAWTIGAKYEGRITADGNIIEGTFRQGNDVQEMKFQRTSQDCLHYLFPRVDPNGERVVSYNYQQPQQPEYGLDVKSLTEFAVNHALIDSLMNDILTEKFKYIHSLLVVKHGYLVLDEYFHDYRADRLHPVHSVTKSIISALIGIAIGQGRIADENEPVTSFYDELQNDDAQQISNDVTLNHLLTMTAGFRWDEWSYPYTDRRNSHAQMNRSAHPVDFVLQQPLMSNPGEKFCYNSGLAIVLGDVLQRATSRRADAFAKKYLFEPLGIDSTFWASYSDGTLQTGGGLHLRPRDMAKFGLLYLQRGRWGKRQIIPNQWVEKSLQSYSHSGTQPYGLLWWFSSYRISNRTVNALCAQGVGGQFVFVFPTENLIIVFTSGNYNNWARATQVNRMLTRYLLPALM